MRSTPFEAQLPSSGTWTTLWGMSTLCLVSLLGHTSFLPKSPFLKVEEDLSWQHPPSSSTFSSWSSTKVRWAECGLWRSSSCLQPLIPCWRCGKSSQLLVVGSVEMEDKIYIYTHTLHIHDMVNGKPGKQQSSKAQISTA